MAWKQPGPVPWGEIMHGNPHYGTSELVLQRVETETRWYWGVGVNTGDAEAVARAQVQATLALAYEQRTANLIAFYGDGPTIPGDDAYHALNHQIVERLGLK